MSVNTGFSHLCALMIGATAGVVVGLLAAPTSGQETRRRLSWKLDEGKSRLKHRGQQVVDETAARIEHGIESGRHKLDQMLQG